MTNAWRCYKLRFTVIQVTPRDAPSPSVHTEAWRSLLLLLNWTHNLPTCTQLVATEHIHHDLTLYPSVLSLSPWGSLQKKGVEAIQSDYSQPHISVSQQQRPMGPHRVWTFRPRVTLTWRHSVQTIQPERKLFSLSSNISTTLITFQNKSCALLTWFCWSGWRAYHHSALSCSDKEHLRCRSACGPE